MERHTLPTGAGGARLFVLVAARLGFLSRAFSDPVIAMVGIFRLVLLTPPAIFWIAAIAALCWYLLGIRFAIFAMASLLLLVNQALWAQLMITLSLVLTSTVIALIIAFPLRLLLWDSRAAPA